jgi:IS5 family transposase
LVPNEPVATLWDHLLPIEVQELPSDLTQIDALLSDPALLDPFRSHWDHATLHNGRPTIPMATYLRVMVIKHRTGWGYETLMQEVSDSIHLRRFCLIPLHQRVPDESTVRKMTRRLGSDVADNLIRALILKSQRERRFRARALRCDSTVTDADIRYPTDAGLCADTVRRLAQTARRVRAAVPTTTGKVQNRTRAVGRRLWKLGRALAHRRNTKQAVQRYTEEAADHVRASLREARRLLKDAKRRRAKAAGVTGRGRRQALDQLEETIRLGEKVVEQVRKRFAGQKIKDRLVSLADPDARPIRRGKLARPNEFGYIVQVTEVTGHTQRGARGLVLPPKLRGGSTHENTLLPETVGELVRLGLKPKEAVFDAGFGIHATAETLRPIGSQVFISGKTKCASKRTRRRLLRYRTGNEGRIGHLKRAYGLDRSRLRGTEGARIWTSWGILAYDLDTLALIGQKPNGPRQQPARSPQGQRESGLAPAPERAILPIHVVPFFRG